MSSDAFSHESIQDPNTIKAFLESLITGIEKGRIVLSTEGQDIVLNPTDLLKFSIKAKVKGERSKLSIKVSWKDEKKEASPPPSTMTIST